MEILLEPTSTKLMLGDFCDSIRIKFVTTGKKRWCDSIRIKLVLDRSSRIKRIIKDKGEVLVVKRYLIFFMEQLVGVANSLVVDVNNPSVGTPKGRRKLLIKGGNEKEIEKSLKNKNACLLCGSFDHNKRRCPKRFEDQEQVLVQQEFVVQEEVF
ncbi:protein FAR1-related sequence 5 [Tanacetum coccineum]